MRKRKRRFKKNLALKVFGTLILVLVPMLVVYSTSIFLTIKEIKTTGETPYSALQYDDILSTYVGQNLLLVNKKSIETKIREHFPYVDEIKITKNIPDQIVIEMTERYKYALLTYNDEMWILDKTGQVLEQGTYDDQYEYLRVFGIEVKTDEITGRQYIDEDKKEAFITVIEAFENTEHMENVSEIRMYRDYDIEIIYTNNFNVKIGNDTQIEYKISIFEEFLLRLTQSDVGIIDVTSPSVSRFIPEKIEQTKYLYEEVIEEEVEDVILEEDIFTETEAEVDVQNDEIIDG